jgi:phage/plasmid-like protein (TIGR03299 family)
MSANIDVRNGVASMFSVREIPWHKLGQVVDGCLTAQDAIEKAHLNWLVEKRDISFMKDDERTTIPNVFATVRTDVNEALGVVGNDYTILQNFEAFDFFDGVVGEGQAIYETAGALERGCRVWIMAKLSGSPITAVPNDEINKYLLLSTSHNGSCSVCVGFTPTRVVCQNTLNIAMNHIGNSINVRHTKSIKGKIDQSRHILGITVNYYKLFEEQMKVLVRKQINSGELKTYLESIYPDNKEAGKNTRTENIRNSVETIFNSSTNRLPGMQGTTYAAFQAVAEYEDHFKPTRGKTNEFRQNNRIKRIWYGPSIGVKTKALDLAMAIAN